MTLSERNEEKVRSALAVLVDATPIGTEFDDLTETQLAPTRQRRSGVLAFSVAFLVVGLIGGLTLWATQDVGPSAASSTDNVLFVPTYTPQDLTLTHATMWKVDGSTTDDPQQAVTTSLSYLRPGHTTLDDDDRFLMIEVDDRFAALERDELNCYEDAAGEERSESETCLRQLEESECSGLARMREGHLDPAACIREAIEGLERLQRNAPHWFGFRGNTEVTITELTLRGKPALLGETEDHSVSVMTFEGGGVVSIVTGQQVDREDVLRIAESLQPVTPDQYATFAATATK